MLVLTRTKNTSVRIGDAITVTVSGFGAGEVTLRVHYPFELELKRPSGEVRGEAVEIEGPSRSDPHAPTRLGASLTMKVDDTVSIGSDITVMVVALLGIGEVLSSVRLGFRAPRSIAIERNDCKLQSARAESGLRTD